jgi:hypothetical protein
MMLLIVNLDMNNTLNSTLKDNPKFIIVSSILVPIVASLIGLAGIVVPSLTANQKNTNTSTESPVSTNADSAENLVANESTVSNIQSKDTFGFVNIDTVLSYAKDTNKTLELKNDRFDDSYEIQFIGGEYYIIGFAKDNFSKDDIILASESVKDNTSLVGIKFKDITKIEKVDLEVSKKSMIKVLSVKAKALKLDVTSH